MNLMRLIVGTTIRAVVYRLVGLAFVLGAVMLSDKAHATAYGDQGAAYVACRAHMSAVPAGYTMVEMSACDVDKGGMINCVMRDQGGNTNPCPGGDASYSWANACSARPQGQPGMINGTITSTGVCSNGCKVVPNTELGTQDFTIVESGNSINFKQGTWVPTGGVCVVDPETPAQPPHSTQGCHATSSGHTVCKGDGKTCVTAPSGFKTCATDPNSTGVVKTNNPRTEATSISAPNTPSNQPTNRPGEAWTPSTPGTTVVNNNTGDVTNVNNWSNNSPNGNEPVPGDGSGGEDGEEEEGGSTSGGGDCATPFTCTGGDPILCGVGQQSWLERCGNDEDNNGQPDWTQIGEGQGEGPTAGTGEEVQVKEFGYAFADKIDDSGFIGSSCPVLPTLDFGPMGTVNLSAYPWWCDLIALIGSCVLFSGACISLAILVR